MVVITNLGLESITDYGIINISLIFCCIFMYIIFCYQNVFPNITLFCMVNSIMSFLLCFVPFFIFTFLAALLDILTFSVIKHILFKKKKWFDTHGNLIKPIFRDSRSSIV